MRIRDIFFYEWLHFTRSQLKVVALILFSLAAIYGLQNGYKLFKKHTMETNHIRKKQEEAFQQVTGWLNEGKKGPDDRPYVDITQPLWAFFYIPSWTWKPPSPMMVYSIGQAEQFGYYKEVTDWSTIFDSDLSEEIANPERLAMGALDFGFTVIYLGPLLLIILLYNIKGYEKDKEILKLVDVQLTKTGKWLVVRTLFYFVLVTFVVFLLMLVYAGLCNIFYEHSSNFLRYLFSSIFYLFIWTLVFGLIIMVNSSSMVKALKMISVWLVFGMILPASVQQAASIEYPAIYMTDFLDAKRQELYDLYDLYELPQDSLKMELLRPELGFQNTLTARDSVLDQSILINTFPYLANRITHPAATKIELRNEAKNNFIRDTYWYNPVSFFLNYLNATCDTDYYAYLEFRKHIQDVIDKRTTNRVMDTWNKKVIDKEKILYYMKEFGHEWHE